MTHVAEIATFDLAPGVSDAEFVALSRASEAFVHAAPGFVLRRLSRGSDGRWTDYVIWDSMAAAQAAAAQFPAQGFAPALIAAILPDSMAMRHETIQWSMAA